MNQPKAASNPQKKNQPSFNQIVEAARQPKYAIDPDRYYSLRPSWRLAKAQMVDPWGWHSMSATEAAQLKDKLASFESMTWAEILVVGKKHHHSVPFDGLTPEGQKHYKKLGLLDEVVSLKLSNLERVIGLLHEGAFSVLWYDKNHAVCKSDKKHT